MNKVLGRKNYQIMVLTINYRKKTETLTVRDFTGKKEFRFNEPVRVVNW